MTTVRPYLVRRRWMTTPDVAAFELTPADGHALPPLEPGAHVEFMIDRAGQPPLVRHYSLCNAPGEDQALVFGIKLEAQSRGGSSWIHGLVEGDRVRLGTVRNLFPLHLDGTRHVLLAGGIGITPVLAMAQALDAIGADYQLHYFVRGAEHVAFPERLANARSAGRLHVHAGLDGAAVRTVLGDLLGRPDAGAHAYCCGPGIFMDSVEEVGRSKRWDESRLHFERFQAAPLAADAVDIPFDVELRRSGKRCHVGVGQTIIQALSEAGCEVMTSCEQGVCGTCLTNVVDGVPDHRDAYLSKAERESGRLIMPCVSRSKSPVLVLDL